jgi:uncharacterized protein (DUF1810 family)
MKFRVFRPQREPGVRLSVADLAILAAAAGASWLMAGDPVLRAASPAPLHLVLTYLCFCNLFRIGTAAEIAWAAVFVVTWATVLAMGLDPYPVVLLATLPALVLAVVFSALWGRYNGIGHNRIARLRRRCNPPAITGAAHLQRYILAQNEGVYVLAKAELSAGRKRSHWIWFIFPNWKGLGVSVYARTYAIESIAEAQAFIAHPVLGARLVKCCEILLGLHGRSIGEIFDAPDDLKVRSCMTLFAAVSPNNSVFHNVIDRYFGGIHDELTLEGMKRE